LFGTNRTKKLT